MVGGPDGRVAVVTGGGRGIGRGIALELVRMGAPVARECGAAGSASASA
jgi:NAD(P)-dependent dehydrogenase (short-subunit alcohol dehydrogenase family)